ncbi:hypothetical protein ACFE04_000559 [Oxalis oulophora]
MGAILSSSASKNTTPCDFSDISSNQTCKRRKLSFNSSSHDNTRLIPSLPDEISLQIIARIPRINYLKFKLISRAWKTAVTSSQLFEVRNELRITEEWLYLLTKVEDNKLVWHALDPVSTKWQKLPPMPNVSFEGESTRGVRIWNVVGSSVRIADVIRGWLGRKDTVNHIPFCGCAVGVVNGRLYVIGGFSRASVLKTVWQYDPILNKWSEGSPMSIGRAYCKTGILNNKLYVAGGVTRSHGGLTPLQSAEVYDPYTGIWSQIQSMPFSKAQVLPTVFLAELLKPIATGMTSYNGKLYVPQSLYCWPFFVDVGGEAYDPDSDSWVEMPAGMGEGWPARQAGTKLGVVVDGELYALDPSSSLDNAKIKVYDFQDDVWKVAVDDVPNLEFSDSESPYLLCGLLGKLNIITKDANQNITILQADVQNHFANFSSVLSSSLDEIANEPTESIEDPGRNLWKVIATRRGRSIELVSCQTLDI